MVDASVSDDQTASEGSNRFDLLVLGGGSGGYACALRAAELGMRVGLVEEDLLGGTCLHRGCIPTKALLHAGEVADAVRDAGQFGIAASIEGVDMAGRQRLQGRRHCAPLQGSCRAWSRAAGSPLVEGRGRLVGPERHRGRRHPARGSQRRARLRLIHPHTARARP